MLNMTEDMFGINDIAPNGAQIILSSSFHGLLPKAIDIAPLVPIKEVEIRFIV